MSYYDDPPTQLADILYQRTNDQLKQLTPFCDACQGATRKDELVRCIHKTMMTPDSLRQMWQQLDDISQKAVAAAYHNAGEFNADAFSAQYGQLPARPKKDQWSWYTEPILLDLFIYDGRLPEDIIPLLAPLVPPPDKFQLKGVAESPQKLKFDSGAVVELTCIETERAGLHDLLAYLRLVDEGQIKITAASGRVTGASINKIAAGLLDGDFFPLPEKIKATDVIRPFGLDVFAQEAGLVSKARGRNELQLTEMGREYYQTRNPALLLEAFETWSQEGTFDELSRISAVKGQNGRGTRLTKPASRREVVVEALSWCPVGEWIAIGDFYRAVKIWHFDFDVETTAYSNLYVGHREYGALYGQEYWLAVKGLYINAIIWEYLGSIGAVDLAFAPSERITWSVEFYTDDDLSLYDNLTHFRINNLGAYLLGQAREYKPAVALDQALFVISPDLQVSLLEPDQLTPNDQSLLEQVAVPEKSGYYRLNTAQLLTALENGANFEQLADFLQQRHSGPLPEEVSTWLDKIDRNRQAFKISDQALLITAASPDLLELVQNDPVLKKICTVTGSKTFVVPVRREKAFREQLKALEYMLQ